MPVQSTKPQKFVAELLRQKGAALDELTQQLQRARAETEAHAQEVQEVRQENAECQRDLRGLLDQRQSFEARFKTAITEVRTCAETVPLCVWRRQSITVFSLICLVSPSQGSEGN